MENEARILILEDTEAHYELVLRELKNAKIPFTPRRVQTEKEFVRELKDFAPTLILSDYLLPTFDGMSAFKIVHETSPNIPFIIVTATMGEETAVECMKAGVADYVLKEHIGRLGPAVKNALERKSSLEALQKTRVQLSEAEHMMKLGSWEWDLETDNIVWSDEMYEIFGISRDVKPSIEVFMERVHPEDKKRLEEKIQAIRSGGPAALQSTPITEYRVLHPRGGTRYILSTQKIFKTEGERVQKMAGVVQDVTSQRQMEQQLLQSQKLEIVGKLAGGIAHDFNNLLTVISGYTDLLLNTTAKENPHYADLEEIKKAADRAQGLTGQLLAFSRREVVHLKPMDLNEVLKSMNNMLRRLIGEDIEFKMTLADDLPIIMADASQLQQVILNLSVNARDAMTKGGALIFKTTREATTSDKAAIRVNMPAGDYVVLAVQDTGCGMSPEVQERLFEPFFTTKEKSKGTGLGLTTCHGILKQMKAFITVDSRVGKGTTFTLYFPLHAPAVETGNASAPSKKDGHTVLLVEDEAIVRNFSARILKGLGYDVIEGKDGMEALDFLRKNKDRKIDILFTDIMMPKMNGKELAEQVHSLCPEIKVLFTSGFIEEEIVRQSVLNPAIAFVRKPFSAEELSQKLEEVLNAKKALKP